MMKRTWLLSLFGLALWFSPLTLSFATGQTYELLLEGTIKPGSADDIIKALNTATPEDTVHIYIRSPGGSFNETIKTLRAIEKTRAKQVITEIVYLAYSGGAFIALAGDEVRVTSDANIIFHMPQKRSQQAYPLRYHEKHKQDQQHARVMGKLMKYYCQCGPFLSDDEWKIYYAGGHVFMKGSAFIKRVKKAKVVTPTDIEAAESSVSPIRKKAYEKHKSPI